MVKDRSKDSGKGVLTRSAKRRQAEEEEAKRKSRRHERQDLLPRLDKVLRPTDILVDTAVQKVIFPPEEGEATLDELKVDAFKEEDGESAGGEPEPATAVENGESTGDDGVAAAATIPEVKDDVLLLKAQIQELKAQVASLEAEKRILHEVTDKVVELYVKFWDPVGKRLHLRAVSGSEVSTVEKWVLSRYSGVTHLTVGLVHGLKEPVEVAGPFQDLQVLKLRKIEGLAHSYIKACLAASQKLERITLPMMPWQEIGKVFETLWMAIVVWNSRLLKEIDLTHLSKVLEQLIYGSPEAVKIEKAYLRLISACGGRYEVRIRNPSTSWPSLQYWSSRDKETLGKCVKVLRMEANSEGAYLTDVPLEQLESLTIAGTGDWIRDLNAKAPPVKWTHLTKLNTDLTTGSAFTGEDASILSSFLVTQSPNLKELRVSGNEEGASALLAPTLMRQLNLRKLVLKVDGNWSFLEEAWPELSSLEELTLNGSPVPTGDVDRNATFLQLKSLRKLWLIGMDGILNTDNGFLCNVLSQMQLTHLVITCRKRITEARLVPRAAIERLMKSPCGQTIQKLTVEGWAFENRFPDQVGDTQDSEDEDDVTLMGSD